MDVSFLFLIIFVFCDKQIIGRESLSLPSVKLMVLGRSKRDCILRFKRKSLVVEFFSLTCSGEMFNESDGYRHLQE